MRGQRALVEVGEAVDHVREGIGEVVTVLGRKLPAERLTRDGEEAALELRGALNGDFLVCGGLRQVMGCLGQHAPD